MEKATAALLGAIVGAVISTVLPPIIGYFSYRRRIKRELHVSLLKLEDRLLKIAYLLQELELSNDEKQHPETSNDEKQLLGMFNDEKRHLGTNLDDYLSCIAALPRSHEYEKHLAIHGEMHPILLARKPEEVRAHLGSALDAIRDRDRAA